MTRWGDELVPNQFDPSLPYAVQLAACGPAAAVAFARFLGRNPSLADVVQLARTVGWSESGGMNGVSNLMALLAAMDVPARILWGGDWEPIIDEASRNRPVIVSTPGHYFCADRYDPATGTLHVGNSGSPALKYGSKWMQLSEMERLEGAVQASIYLNT
ncbi:MAG: hypothetical protein M0T85_15660 [Dehalococcoidales bacterium]|nr:hypothetical protein [Dehalococcoidales bacterium]